jgi:hypothetical protein
VISNSGRLVTRRGAPGAWLTSSKQEGPPGSNLHIKFYINSRQGECADIEESVSGVARRLARITGEHAHVRAIDWMEGFVAGKDYANRPKVVQQAPVKKRKNQYG